MGPYRIDLKFDTSSQDFETPNCDNTWPRVFLPIANNGDFEGFMDILTLQNAEISWTPAGQSVGQLLVICLIVQIG